jgi:hypothetical protein
MDHSQTGAYLSFRDRQLGQADGEHEVRLRSGPTGDGEPLSTRGPPRKLCWLSQCAQETRIGRPVSSTTMTVCRRSVLHARQ